MLVSDWSVLMAFDWSVSQGIVCPFFNSSTYIEKLYLGYIVDKVKVTKDSLIAKAM